MGAYEPQRCFQRLSLEKVTLKTLLSVWNLEFFKGEKEHSAFYFCPSLLIQWNWISDCSQMHCFCAVWHNCAAKTQTFLQATPFAVRLPSISRLLITFSVAASSFTLGQSPVSRSISWKCLCWKWITPICTRIMFSLFSPHISQTFPSLLWKPNHHSPGCPATRWPLRSFNLRVAVSFPVYENRACGGSHSTCLESPQQTADIDLSISAVCLDKSTLWLIRPMSSVKTPTGRVKSYVESES